MSLVILEAVEVLVPLLTDIALVWLLLFHTLGPGIWCLRVRIDDRECAITVLVQSLIIVAVL